jgi:type IV pilus assembly protein PilP
MQRSLLSSTICLSLLVPLFFLFSASHAAQEVVYKDSRPMKKVFETPKETGSVEPSKESGKAVAKYTYDPTGKTDPFRSFLVEQEIIEEKKARKPRTYLETLDLSQLELIAIIVGPKGNWAMVRDSKGVGHVIQKGTSMGTNSGVVHEITEKEVTVREEYRDFRGKTLYKDIAKKLPSLE